MGKSKKIGLAAKLVTYWMFFEKSIDILPIIIEIQLWA